MSKMILKELKKKRLEETRSLERFLDEECLVYLFSPIAHERQV